MEFITNKTIAERTELPARAIQFYVKEGLIQPEKGGEKQGNWHQFSVESLFKFSVIGHLYSMGTQLKTLKKVVPAIDMKKLKAIFKNQVESVRAGKMRIFIIIGFSMADAVTVDIASCQYERSSKRIVGLDMFGIQKSIVLDITDDYYSIFH